MWFYKNREAWEEAIWCCSPLGRMLASLRVFRVVAGYHL